MSRYRKRDISQFTRDLFLYSTHFPLYPVERICFNPKICLLHTKTAMMEMASIFSPYMRKYVFEKHKDVVLKTDGDLLQFLVPRCRRIHTKEPESFTVVAAFIFEFLLYLQMNRLCYRFHFTAYKALAAVFHRDYVTHEARADAWLDFQEYAKDNMVLLRSFYPDSKEKELLKKGEFQSRMIEILKKCDENVESIVLNRYETSLIAEDLSLVLANAITGYGEDEEPLRLDLNPTENTIKRVTEGFDYDSLENGIPISCLLPVPSYVGPDLCSSTDSSSEENPYIERVVLVRNPGHIGVAPPILNDHENGINANFPPDPQNPHNDPQNRRANDFPPDLDDVDYANANYVPLNPQNPNNNPQIQGAYDLPPDLDDLANPINANYIPQNPQNHPQIHDANDFPPDLDDLDNLINPNNFPPDPQNPRNDLQIQDADDFPGDFVDLDELMDGMENGNDSPPHLSDPENLEIMGNEPQDDDDDDDDDSPSDPLSAGSPRLGEVEAENYDKNFNIEYESKFETRSSFTKFEIYTSMLLKEARVMYGPTQLRRKMVLRKCDHCGIKCYRFAVELFDKQLKSAVARAYPE